MTFDKPVDDDLEVVSDISREDLDGHSRHAEEGTPARAEAAETRTPAECNNELRANVTKVAQEQQNNEAESSSDAVSGSAWDTIDPASRPPLDSLRIPDARAAHILDGDATGGGHRPGTDKPGKTEFPADWDDDKIIDSILSVACSPDSAVLQGNGRWKVEGVRDEVALAVIIAADGRIWTAYPLPGSPGVKQNPREH